jgi:hypothetical protein
LQKILGDIPEGLDARMDFCQRGNALLTLAAPFVVFAFGQLPPDLAVAQHNAELGLLKGHVLEIVVFAVKQQNGIFFCAQVYYLIHYAAPDTHVFMFRLYGGPGHVAYGHAQVNSSFQATDNAAASRSAA